MPVLKVDGRQICQSQAILRYLGRELGLVGKSEYNAAKADEFLMSQVDMMMLLPWEETDKEKQVRSCSFKHRLYLLNGRVV